MKINLLIFSHVVSYWLIGYAGWLNLLDAAKQQITVMTNKQSLYRPLCINRQDTEIYTITKLDN